MDTEQQFLFVKCWALAPVVLFIAGNGLFLLRLVFGWSFTLFRICYGFNTVLLPLVLLAISWILLVSCRTDHDFPRRVHLGVAYVLLAALFIAVRVYATHIEPRRLIVRHVRIESSKLTQPVRLLHISDFQARHIGSYEKRAIATMCSLTPDLVIHSGDLLQCPTARLGHELPELRKLLATLKPSMGKYNVYGDTDWRLNNAGITEVGGLTMLSNDEVTVTKDGVRVSILGLSHRTAGARPASLRPLVEDWLSNTDSNDFCVLVGHAPDFILDVADLPADLCLAGHTHGGQVRIPFVGPILTLSSVPKRQARGYHEVGNTRINVSAGIGTEHAGGMPPLRINCPPEITLIALVPAQ